MNSHVLYGFLPQNVSTEVCGWGPQFERALATQIVTLAPMAPHFASELWAGFVSAPHRVNAVSDEIDWERPVLRQRWPEVDPEYCLDLLCKVGDFCHVCRVQTILLCQNILWKSK